MLYPHLAENIKKNRKELGLTQKQLADYLMKSEITIRKYESGNVNIPPATLFDICRILNSDPEELLGTDSDQYHIKNFGETLSETLESAKRKFEDSFSNIYKNSEKNKTTYVLPKDNGEISHNEAILGIAKYIQYLGNKENYVVDSDDYDDIIKSAEELITGKLLIFKKNRGTKLK